MIILMKEIMEKELYYGMDPIPPEKLKVGQFVLLDDGDTALIVELSDRENPITFCSLGEEDLTKEEVEEMCENHLCQYTLPLIGDTIVHVVQEFDLSAYTEQFKELTKEENWS